MNKWQKTIDEMLNPGWDDAALEIIDGLPHWVKQKDGKPVAKKKLSEADCEMAVLYFQDRLKNAEPGGEQEGFAA